MAEKPTYQELQNRINQLLTERSHCTTLEADLKRRLQFTESLLMGIPTPIFFKDTQGRYQGCNPAFTEIMGVTDQELRGKTVQELWPSEHAEVYHQKDLELMEHPASQIYRFEVRDKSGTIRPVIFYKSVFHDELGKVAGLVGGFVDITEHKQTEKALQQTEEQYLEIANQIPGMVYQFVLHENGSFSVPFISKQVFEYSGQRPEEIMDQPDLFFKPIHSADIELIQEKISQSAKTLNDFTAEHRLISPNQETLWFQVKSRPRLLDNKDILWNGISTDITERKSIEEELKRSEERYHSVSELTSDYSYAYQVGPDGELTIDWVTGALVRLTGFTKEELTSLGGWERLIYPEDMSIPLGQLKSLLSNQLKIVEYRIIDKSGNIRWMRDIARPIWDEKGNRLSKIYGAVQEITEQKEAEKALRASQERFLTVLNSIDATIYVADLETYEILFMNKNMIDSFGKDMTGETCWDVFRGESKPCRHCTNDRIIDKNGNTTGVYVWQGENPITGRWYINYDRAIEWTDGRLVRLQIATDITDQKEMEEQLYQAQKMEAVGTLAGGIAHNFNNLLMGILGRASLISVDLESSHPLVEHIKAIKEYTHSAVNLTKQLLGIVRGGKYEIKSIEMNELVRESAAMFGRTRKEIQIHINTKPSRLVVEADRSQIEQVLLNMYVNAWQSMPDGGELRLETSIVSIHEAACKPHQIKPGRYSKISVTDTGIGMDEATRRKIFDPFFTTKEEGQGTGLGLASAYGIIKNHGGMITVSSNAGHGTTFNIYLPMSKKEVQQEVAPEAKMIKGSETILLVDDEKMITEVGRLMLEKLGYTVVVSNSGKEAIEVIATQGDTIKLVILDMIMPGMGGDITFDRLREIQPEIPVMLSSGYSINGHATKIMQKGCNGFIQKPFSLSELSQKIRKILD